ncbi:transporter substrate-binding domain-containing protein [Geomonas sp. RF6]|uniref:substrate-binding periplasmic protein n=1 Tax=Geomonas sp. RF6 TaxID=2897342 RepID=UPI001E4B5295|nr:transporter substrate-binding domain-containing protein [Geomonas sp. RF6]UFS68998.1 transporter substrate-binding domain-containing protein [Geomonas sp. RF6]
MKRSLTMSLLLLLLTTATIATAHTRVVYPASESRGETRFDDLIEILHTALDTTVPDYGPYTLQSSPLGMNEARYLAELRKPAGTINVAWSGTSEQKEREYIAVRIPLRKGILGYRIAFIAKDKQADVDRIKTAKDLKGVIIGQGIGWGDTAIYAANGIPVETAGYDSLFRLCAAKRIDLFPRGINEIFAEYAARRDAIPNLAIEKNLLIYYPWPYYFFFNRSNAALAKRVEAGLRKMIRNGSFDAIFMKYNREAILKADLKHRRVIRLVNPTLPKDTPLNDPTLWFDPATMK